MRSHDDSANSTPGLAIIVIGRNEGHRLSLSLASALATNCPIIYVDSGSSDDSCESAREMGVPVLRLSTDKPFSAGRARNEGLAEVVAQHPGTEYAIFLDGDCLLDREFPRRAIETLKSAPGCAIVTGQLSERFPEHSVFNRLCAIEWATPCGVMKDVNNLGGIMAVRVSDFQSVGGFNLRAIAGEEPDLGARLMLSGRSIIKIHDPMATHDANMLHFKQWWRRAVRSGHAIAHRYAEHGRSELVDGRRELISAVFWAFALPLTIVMSALPTRGLSVALAGLYLILGWRIYRWYRTERSLSAAEARLIARFLIYAKFAELEGIARYCFNRLRGRFEIIEHK